MFSPPSLSHLRLAECLEEYQDSFILEGPKLLCSCKCCQLFSPFLSSLAGIVNTVGVAYLVWLGFVLGQAITSSSTSSATTLAKVFVSPSKSQPILLYLVGTADTDEDGNRHLLKLSKTLGV